MDISAQPALKIENLDKSFGAIRVLRNITVSMAAGDFLVLVGPSGCGKSTLLNCIAGLEDASSGTIEIAGRDVTRVPPRDRDIAMVFQSYALYPTMSVAENIGFGMKVRGLAKPEIAAKVSEVAHLLQIEHLLDRRPSQLSGGQRQRVAMGRALVREPKLFLFDEPLSNLDAKLRVEMRAEIKRLHETTQSSIVYVTHDQVEAMTLASRIVVLKDGEIQQVGTPEEIYDRPANMFVADFMGSPPMNLIPGQFDKAAGRLVFAGGQSVAMTHLPAEVSAHGNDLVVGIRPEHFSTDTNVGPVLEITPTLVENAGSDAYVSFPLGGVNTVARLHGRFRHETGTPVSLGLDLAHLCFFDRETGRLLFAAPTQA